MKDNRQARIVQDEPGHPRLHQPKGTATARVMAAAITGAEKHGFSKWPGDGETCEEGKAAYLALQQFANDYIRSVFGGE